MIQAQLSQDTITSASEEAFSLHEKSRWGEKKHSHIEYSSVEALALMQGKKLALFQHSKPIDVKFGSEFRVYEKGVKPGQDHASWLLFPLREHETLTWYDFAAKNRVATSTNKKLLLAIVDDEGDVTYYVCQWFRP